MSLPTRTLSALLLLLLLLLPAAVPAQAGPSAPATAPVPVDWPRAVRIVDPAAHGIEARAVAGQTVEITFPKLRVPLANPVHDWEVGALPDGSYVILAGGVRDGLDLYRVDPAHGNLDLFETHGGRRRPEPSAGGCLGSWPIADGRHLLLFTYEKDQQLWFWAIGFPGQVYGSRDLPLGHCGVRVAHSGATEVVRIEFEGCPEKTLEFLHPLAPRLAPGSGSLDFGAVAAGARAMLGLPLSNQGGRPLCARICIEGPDADRFSLARGDAAEVGPQRAETALELRIAAGGRADVALSFVPAPGREAMAQLRIDSEVSTARGVVPLRGRAADFVAARPPAVAEAGSAEQPTPVEAAARTRTDRAAPPKPAEPPPQLPEAAIAELFVDRLDDRLVELRGRLALPSRLAGRAARPLAVVARNPRTAEDVRAPLEPGGFFRLAIGAAAADRLGLGLDFDRQSGSDAARAEPTFVVLDPVRPALRRDGTLLVGSCRADAPCLLLLVRAADGALRAEPRRVLRTWRGRGDARGRLLVPLSFLGRGDRSLHLMLVVCADDGSALCSPLLEVSALD